MSKILAYTSPALGHLYPLTPVLLELAARGHDIVLRTHSSAVDLMNELGFDAAAVDPRIEDAELEDWRASNPRKALNLSVALLAKRAENEAPELTALIDEEQPDAVIVDTNAFGALAAAEAWGGNWAALCPFPLPLGSEDAPPFGPGLKPATGPLGRLRDRALRPIIYRTFDKAMRPATHDVRIANGLAPLEKVDDLFRKPPLLILATAEPFEYPRSDWPDSILMIGASPWEPPADPPDWLDEIDRPIVLVTTSSEFQNDGKLIEVAFEALAGEDVAVVATVPAGDAASFRPPANGRVVSFTPHGPLLDRAVCAITHGGMGGTQKALAKGVPVCAVAFGRDQLEVARRVETADAGVMLTSRKLSPERLRKAVALARTKTAGAQRVADGFLAAGGAAAAADAIERWDSVEARGHPAAPAESATP